MKMGKQGGHERHEYVPQPDCPLLQLPPEVRDKVYNFLFLSTRVTFGTRFNDGSPKYIMPAAHSLALLSVCRQIFDETKTLWLQRLLFNFESVESLFDKLSPLPSATLSQIRYLRTRQDSWILSFDDIKYYHELASILKLLPALRLDTLTVLGPLESFDGYVNCVALEDLINNGNGWKELHYVSPDSAMLGFVARPGRRPRAGPYRRQPQPSSWKDSLLSRDGIDSKATVVIYQAAEGKVVGAPFVKNNSRRLSQVVPPDTLETFGLKEDPQLMSDGQKEKELLVVVKRGDTDIAERVEGPYDPADIRQQTDGMAWPAIKANLNSDNDDTYDDDDFPQEIETLEVDTYKNRDEYVWD
jgi:hypothetical protein